MLQSVLELKGRVFDDFAIGRITRLIDQKARLASYFAGLQARDADVDALWGALDDRADALNVGVPAA